MDSNSLYHDHTLVIAPFYIKQQYDKILQNNKYNIRFLFSYENLDTTNLCRIITK